LKTQWQILLYVLCFNLAIGVIVGVAVPGTAFFSPTTPLDTEEAEGQFDPEEVMEWGSTPFSGIPLIGDIFAGFQFLISNFRFLIDGFPLLLEWMADSFGITGTTAEAPLLVITWTIRAVFTAMISIFLIEFISGRVFSD